MRQICCSSIQLAGVAHNFRSGSKYTGCGRCKGGDGNLFLKQTLFCSSLAVQIPARTTEKWKNFGARKGDKDFLLLRDKQVSLRPSLTNFCKTTREGLWAGDQYWASALQLGPWSCSGFSVGRTAAAPHMCGA